MSSVANPKCPVMKYVPAEGETHPMVMLPPCDTQPFTLLKDSSPANTYSIRFHNEMTAGQGGNTARMYLAAFTTSVSDPTWTASVTAEIGAIISISFNTTDLESGVTLWVGAWWNDGTYPGTEDGVVAYFADHPSGGEHHTVPIMVG